jgi:hypothetical protein
VRLAAIVTIAVGLLLASGAAAKNGSDVVALVWKDREATIRLLDAATLAPHGGSLAIRHTGPGPHAFSPDGSRLAFHTEKDGVRILAVPSLRVLRTVRPGIRTWGLYWQSARRLLVLEYGTILVVDPATGRVVARRDWDVGLVTWAPWHGGVVALATPSVGIGPARLIVASRDLRIREVVLDRILAGADAGEDDQGPFRVATPGLALDPAGGRAFVAGASVVASVDLKTLVVRNQAPARTSQKVSDGPQRVAAWLGHGTLAVSGADYAFEGRVQRMTPYGLRLVNVDTGRSTIVEPRATDVAAVGGIALASGVVWTQPSSGMGVSAYDASGNLVWHRYDDATVQSPRVVGGRAYAFLGRGTWHVLDPLTGRTTATRSGVSLNVYG